MMALFNNQTSYVDENVSFGGQYTQMNSHQTVDVLYSTLQPTATEFHPLSSNNGAIRKEPQRHSYNRHKGTRPNSYGSGRTFSNSRGYRQRNERSEETLLERQRSSETDQQHEQYRNPIGISNSYYNQNDENLRSAYTNNSSNSTKYLSNYNYQYEGSSNFQSHSRNNYGEDYSGHASNFGRYNRSNFSNRTENLSSNGAVRKNHNYNYTKKNSYYKNYKDKSRFNTPQSNGFNKTKTEDNYQTDYHGSSEKNNVNFKSSYRSSDNYTSNKYSRQNVKDFGNQSLKKSDKNIKVKKGE